MSVISSDVLEQQFGTTSLQVIEQGDHERIITTSAESTDAVLEISWVRFKNTNTHRDIQKRIRAGTSMGKAFRSQNIPFTRKIVVSGKVAAPPFAQNLFQSKAEVTLVEISVYVGLEQTHYADITELYAPEVDWPLMPSQDDQTLRAYSEAMANRLASL